MKPTALTPGTEVTTPNGMRGVIIQVKPGNFHGQDYRVYHLRNKATLWYTASQLTIADLPALSEPPPNPKRRSIMEQQIAIFCFDKTGIMAQPWAEAGYLCYCVDLQHPEGETREGNIIKVGASVYDWLPPRGPIAFAAFFPPCTDLAVSGARWFSGKGLEALRDAVGLFAWSARIAEWCECPYLIENPVSTISSYWRKPDYAFDPCDYAGYLADPVQDAYTKRTCLWTGGGFVMPERKAVVPVLGSKMHKLPPGPERANLRSATPEGFARAVFEANHRRTQNAAA